MLYFLFTLNFANKNQKTKTKICKKNIVNVNTNRKH